MLLKVVVFTIAINKTSACLTFDLPHLLPQLALAHETLQFFGQDAVFMAEFGVSIAVLLDLSLDLDQCLLKVGGDVIPLLLILPAALKGLVLGMEVGNNGWRALC